MSAWLRSETNSISEIFTLQPQRLNPINVWYSYCTKAIGDHWVGVNISSLVVNLEHFSRICIVIDHHPCITNDSHTTNFTGMAPAHMNMRGHPICKHKIEMGNILEMPLEMRICLYPDLFRLLIK